MSLCPCLFIDVLMVQLHHPPLCVISTYLLLTNLDERSVTNIKFTFNIEPQTQLRPRASRRGRAIVVYDPPKVKAFKAKLHAMAQEQFKGEPLDGPLEVNWWFYRPVQTSISKAEKDRRLSGVEPPVVKPDLSNYLKASEDALNGVLWVDDRVIVIERCFKRYSETPRIEVEVKKYRRND